MQASHDRQAQFNQFNLPYIHHTAAQSHCEQHVLATDIQESVQNVAHVQTTMIHPGLRMRCVHHKHALNV